MVASVLIVMSNEQAARDCAGVCPDSTTTVVMNDLKGAKGYFLQNLDGIDIVVINGNMPGGSLTAIKEFRKGDGTRGFFGAIIGVTGQSDLVPRMLRAGCDHVYSQTELLQELPRLIHDLTVEIKKPEPVAV